MSTINYYELELAAYFLAGESTGKKFLSANNPNAAVLLDGSLVVMPVADFGPGPALEGIHDNLFAEVAIPHLLSGTGYTYTFHIFNIPNHIPAFEEAMLLKGVIVDIHARYGDRCEYRGQVEMKEITCEDCGDTGTCRHCRGSGEDPDGNPGSDCPVCEGSGICDCMLIQAEEGPRITDEMIDRHIKCPYCVLKNMLGDIERARDAARDYPGLHQAFDSQAGQVAVELAAMEPCELWQIKEKEATHE